MNTPAVTVLMPVYNGAQYLREAMESILAQTFTDFEFLIVDDDSTDETPRVLEEYTRKDARVRVVRNKKNLGIAGSLNRGLELAAAPLIARMDADDICLPRRLELQVAFMENNPDVWVCGGQLEVFGDGQWEMLYPLAHDAILAEMLFSSPVAHPATILRLENFLAHDLRYDERYHIVSDYLLWVAAAFTGKARFANLPETVLRYRLHGVNITGRETFPAERVAALGYTLRLLGMFPAEQDIKLHTELGFFHDPNSEYLKRVTQWFRRLEEANAEKKLMSESALRLALAKRWHKLGEMVVLDRNLAAWRIFCSRYFCGLPWENEAHMRHELTPRIRRKIKNIFRPRLIA